ncbi:MAG: hypothetical protein H6601_08870 [Flavobacteriales bacterium]|nr:hypothetical protein [Flavobacteriales bacterium]
MCLFASTTVAQHFEWAKNIGGLGLDAARALTTDSEGNVIVAGSFSGTASIAGTWYSGDGVSEAFVAKFSPNGDLLWARVISGPLEDMARSVVTEENGHIYVVGHFTDTVTFYQGQDAMAGARSEGGQDVFVVKYDPDGNYVWHITCGGPADDTATDIDWYQWSGMFYVSGGFQGRGIFGNTPILSNGLTDAFLMKVDADGNVHWVWNGGGDEHDIASAVAVDKTNGSVYVVGDYYEQAEFDGEILESVGSSDMYIARFDEAGQQIWVRSNGGTNVDVSTGVGVDLNSKVYVCGYYQLTTNFQNHSATALGYNDVFLSQFDENGNCIWLSSAGSNALDNCLGMDVAWDGTTYLTGMFDGEMFADDVSFEGNGYDIFVLCYNPSGDVRYGRAAGAASSDFGMAACLGPDQSLYISGYYFYYADFDNITIGAAQNGDAFIAKMTDILDTRSLEEPISNCLKYDPFNQCVRLQECPDVEGWKLFDALGRELDGGPINGNCIPVESKGSLLYFQLISSNQAWSLPVVGF